MENPGITEQLIWKQYIERINQIKKETEEKHRSNEESLVLSRQTDTQQEPSNLFIKNEFQNNVLHPPQQNKILVPPQIKSNQQTISPSQFLQNIKKSNQGKLKTPALQKIQPIAQPKAKPLKKEKKVKSELNVSNNLIQASTPAAVSQQINNTQKQDQPIFQQSLNLNLDFTQQLVIKAQNTIKASQAMLQKSEKVLPKVKDVADNIQTTSSKIIRALEQKLQKLSLKNEQADPTYQSVLNEVKIYATQQLQQFEQMESQIVQMSGLLNPLIDMKIQKLQFQSELSIIVEPFNLQIEQVQYESIFRKLEEQIIALKVKDQDIIDILKFTLSHNEVKTSRVCAIQCNPQYIVCQQDRLIYDNMVVDLKSQNLIQNFEEVYQDAFIMDDQQLLLSADRYAKLVQVKWDGSQYQKVCSGIPFNYGGSGKLASVYMIKRSPFINDPSCLFLSYKRGTIFKLQLNYKQFSQSARTKIYSCGLIKDYQFIDDSRMIVISDKEAALVDYNTQQVIKSIRLINEESFGIPKQFDIHIMPVILQSQIDRNGQNQIVIKDVMQQGYNGHSPLEDGKKQQRSKSLSLTFLLQTTLISHSLLGQDLNFLNKNRGMKVQIRCIPINSQRNIKTKSSLGRNIDRFQQDHTSIKISITSLKIMKYNTQNRNVEAKGDIDPEELKLNYYQSTASTHNNSTSSIQNLAKQNKNYYEKSVEQGFLVWVNERQKLNPALKYVNFKYQFTNVTKEDFLLNCQQLSVVFLAFDEVGNYLNVLKQYYKKDQKFLKENTKRLTQAQMAFEALVSIRGLNKNDVNRLLKRYGNVILADDYSRFMELDGIGSLKVDRLTTCFRGKFNHY